MITNNVDCTDKGNVTQAKHELHRAVETRDSSARTILLGDWSVKWGEALVEIAEDYDPEIECLDAELSRLESEYSNLEDENDDLENQVSELEEEVKELKAKIEELEAK